jgi:hypothetical protein
MCDRGGHALFQDLLASRLFRATPRQGPDRLARRSKARLQAAGRRFESQPIGPLNATTRSQRLHRSFNKAATRSVGSSAALRSVTATRRSSSGPAGVVGCGGAPRGRGRGGRPP